jgi:hypothetical protein
MAMKLKNAELCYLLAFPDSTEKTPEPPEQIRGLKDAPYFQPIDISVRTLATGGKFDAVGVQGTVLQQGYDERVQIVECHYTLDDPLSLRTRAAVEKALQEKFVPAEYRVSGMFEEYAILLLRAAAPGPDRFVDKNAPALARFIRAQRETFDQRDIQDILSSRVRYSNTEMTLVDWQAALIIAPEGDFQSDIELLKIGNYQLLRYRMLDENVEASLRTISDQFRAGPTHTLRPAPSRGEIRRIVHHRLELMLDFEHTDQNLLLIGDWYTAQLYHAIQEEFYLKEWKEAVRTKLDNLEDLIQTIKENFSLSWQSLMETVQITGWLILLIGYFILFFIESYGSLRTH